MMAGQETAPRPDATAGDRHGAGDGPAAGGRVSAAFQRRAGPAGQLADQADQLAGAALAMAVRFHAGGTLMVFGTGSASTDAQHVAVEFVHPVIVGKRALPAISLTCDVATVTALASRDGLDGIFSCQLAHLARPGDIALGIMPDAGSPGVLAGLRAARDRGMLPIALAGGAGCPDGVADYLITAASPDPRVVKELHVTAYHILWELVHVFLEQPGVLGPGVLG